MNTINIETGLEHQITQDPLWQEGAKWGKPRRGHPEGSVEAHIVEVLENINQMDLEGISREDMRLIALIHDTFKYKVDTSNAKCGENHHAMIARRFAEKYIPEREDLLDIIELHDEAYNAYITGYRKGNWQKAHLRAQQLIKRLGDGLELYLAFYEADNFTGNKSQDSLKWFFKQIST